MDYKDQLFIIRNRLFEKRNIILAIVLTIIFLILFSCLTIIKFSVENKNEILKSEIGRTYLVYPSENQVDLVKNIEHIELIASNKYQTSTRFESPSFDSKDDAGILLIKPLLKDYDIKIKKGDTIKKKYEIVCSDIFYPHEYNDRIYKNLFLSGKDILNKKITVISNNEDSNEKEITLNIVGTYKNKFMEEANTCYTNIETYDEISSKYMGWEEIYDIEGNLNSKTYYEYEDYIIRVDDQKNIEQVLNALYDKDIKYENIFILDTGFLSALYIIPLFISILIIILILLILYSFIAKKNTNRLNNIGFLKAIGYKEENIISLTINENIIILITSYVLAMIPYFIVLKKISYTLLAEVTYTNYILNVPYVSIFLSIIIFIFIIRLIVVKNCKKVFNLSIQELLMK